MAHNHDLADHGLAPRGDIHWDLCPATLIEAAVRRKEGVLTADGPFNAITVPTTGRSPRDRYVVRSGAAADNVNWGDVNIPVDDATFDAVHQQVAAYLSSRPELFARDVFAGADPDHRLAVRSVNENAWHNLFIHNMFLRPEPADLESFSPGFTILHAPEHKIEGWEALGLRSANAVIVNLDRGMVVVAGTRYAGEMKKSIFSVLNYLLPLEGVLSMHCSANVGDEGDSALFFGLSGTGKTTLSADPKRALIGDDEHGWDEDGIFNFEGGCYAKVIRLSEESEPEIYSTTRRFGTILENVMVDERSRRLDLDDDQITENTRASYPIPFISNALAGGQAGHPNHIFFLTADAFGVLPPISRLTPAQAMYHFLSGYTAKVAGTEKGVSEPEATFSACFGSPFLTLHPSVYARLLGEKMTRHQAQVWLVNTGWTAGPYGSGHRMPIRYTRAMLHAALDGDLDDVPSDIDPVFGLHVPHEVPGVPSGVLHPRASWDDPEAFDRQAARLAHMFRANFARFEDQVDDDVRRAGPPAA